MADGRSRRTATDVLLQIAGAVGAGLLILYLFGGLVMWVRSGAAGVPADQTVATLPKELLVVVGLRTVILEIFLFVVLGASATLVAQQWNRSLPDRHRIAPGIGIVSSYLLALLVLGLVVAASTIGPSTRLERPWVLAAAGLATAVATAVYGLSLNRRLGWIAGARPAWSTGRVLALSLPAAAVAGATLGLAYEAAKTPIYPPVKIVWKEKHGSIEGFFIAETSNAIVIGSGLCDASSHQLSRLLLVPRDDVAAVVVGRSVRLSNPERRQAEWKSLGVCSS